MEQHDVEIASRDIAYETLLAMIIARSPGFDLQDTRSLPNAFVTLASLDALPEHLRDHARVEMRDAVQRVLELAASIRKNVISPGEP